MAAFEDENGEINQKYASLALIVFGSMFFIIGIVEFVNNRSFVIFLILSAMCIPAGIYGIKRQQDSINVTEYQPLQDSK